MLRVRGLKLLLLIILSTLFSGCGGGSTHNAVDPSVKNQTPTTQETQVSENSTNDVVSSSPTASLEVETIQTETNEKVEENTTVTQPETEVPQTTPETSSSESNQSEENRPTESNTTEPAGEEENPLTIDSPQEIINTAPSSDDQSIILLEDTPNQNIQLRANDTENDPLTFIITTQPTHGTLHGDAPTLTYTPDENYNGNDRFRFKVNDGHNDSNESTISLQINSVNDAPTATSQSLTLQEDSSQTIQLTGSDIDNDTLSYIITVQPTQGTLSGEAPNLTYTPNTNYHGSDRFTFKVNDGENDSDESTIELQIESVNDTPTANAQSLTLQEDSSKTIQLTGSDIENEPLTFVITKQPTYGKITGEAPHLTYIPNTNYYGTDNFQFSVNDGQSSSIATTVTLHITAVNDMPTANAGANQSGFVNQAMNISGSGEDSDGSIVSYRWTNDSGNTIATTASFSYTPTSAGTEQLTLTVADNNGGTDSDTISISATEPIDAGAFITIWKTDNPSSSNPIADDPRGTPTNSRQIRINTVGKEGEGFFNYDYTVDWGDGSVDRHVGLGESDFYKQGNIVHTYTQAGTYTVKITGTFPRIYFGHWDENKLISIEQWGQIKWETMRRAFRGCRNMVIHAADRPDLSRVTDGTLMFQDCSLLNQDISDWDVSHFTQMGGMFRGANRFNQDISSWNVSNVQDMTAMFIDAASFNQDISSWNVSSVRTMNEMFSGSGFNQDIGSWNVSRVNNMQNMFYRSSLSTLNYDSILNGWAMLSLRSNVTLGANQTHYSDEGRASRQYMIDNFGWTIIDAGEI